MTHAVCAISYLTISKWKQLAGIDLCTQYSYQDNFLPRSSFSLLARSSFSKVSTWFQYSFSSRFAIHFVLLVCFHLCAHSEEYSYMLGTKQNYTMNFCRLIWVGPSSAANFSSARGRKENQGTVSWLEDILLYPEWRDIIAYLRIYFCCEHNSRIYLSVIRIGLIICS